MLCNRSVNQKVSWGLKIYFWTYSLEKKIGGIDKRRAKIQQVIIFNRAIFQLDLCSNGLTMARYLLKKFNILNGEHFLLKNCYLFAYEQQYITIRLPRDRFAWLKLPWTAHLLFFYLTASKEKAVAVTVKYSATGIKFNHVIRIGLGYCCDSVFLMENQQTNHNTLF